MKFLWRGSPPKPIIRHRQSQEDHGVGFERTMKETAVNQIPRIPFWAIFILAFMPAAAVLGFVAGESFPITLAIAAAVMGLALLGMTPFSLPVKLIFVLVGFSFLQKVFGYIKFGEVRG